MVQGTIYPDVLESGTENSAVIKSHHNVGGLPEDLNFQLIEPLRSLYKDEVRQVGELLGLPEEITWRQPFPGPGLAIRIIGEVTGEKLLKWMLFPEEIRKVVDRKFKYLLCRWFEKDEGNKRTYYPIIFRVIHSKDMTQIGQIPHIHAGLYSTHSYEVNM